MEGLIFTTIAHARVPQSDQLVKHQPWEWACGMHRHSFVSEMIQLGLQSAVGGAAKPAVQHRVDKAMAAYYGEPDFRRQTLSLWESIQRYAELITHILLDCCEGWRCQRPYSWNNTPLKATRRDVLQF